MRNRRKYIQNNTQRDNLNSKNLERKESRERKPRYREKSRDGEILKRKRENLDREKTPREEDRENP